MADEWLYTQHAVTTRAAGTTDDDVVYDPWDILVRNTWYDDYYGEYYNDWWKLFEGEDYGLGPKHKINAISIPYWWDMGEDAPIYMTFVQNAIFVPGITPLKVYGMDVVVFDPVEETFELVFDGSDVGLTNLTAEKIDGLDYWPPEYWTLEAEFPYDCSEGVFFISTAGNYRVPAANGGTLFGRGSDVLMFCATNLGWDTAGFWFNSFDGVTNNVINYNSINSLDVSSVYFEDDQVEEDTAALSFYFTSRRAFTAGTGEEGAYTVAGGPSEVFYAHSWFCDPNLDCTYCFHGPYEDFNETEPALNGAVEGFDLLYDYD
jgi:hypothetical protein